MPEDQKGPRYVVVGDFAVDYGWVVDWHAYMAIPWWRRMFSRNDVIITGGTREAMRGEAAKLNAAYGNSPHFAQLSLFSAA